MNQGNLETIEAFDTWRLHKLKGKLDNYYAIWVDENYRIWFLYDEESESFEVIDYGDYH